MDGQVIKGPSGNVIFKPWDGPQRRFWDFRGRYALYGGSGYTGKTQLLMWYPWQQVQEENDRIANGEQDISQGWCLYLRRETKMLREVLARCKREYPKALEEIDKCWKAMDRTYVLPNGYRITFDHMENDDDWSKYQGYQFSLVCWDELTTFTEEQFDMIDSWLRAPAGCKLDPIHRAGSNPVGRGRDWVRKRFVRAAPPGDELIRTITADVQLEDGSWKKETVRRVQIFVPARVTDNKSVNQAEYIATFEGKSESIKQAMLYGNWDAAIGDLIGAAWDDRVHVVEPFRLPSFRPRFSVCHFAYAKSTALWFDCDYDGNLLCYRDLQLENHTADMFAERMRELEEEAGEWSYDKDRGSRLTLILGPGTTWPKAGQRGPSVYEEFRRVGFYVKPADENIQAAANQIRTRLLRRTKDEKGKPTVPGLRFFKTCTNALEQIPSMTADKNSPDEPDPKVEASAYRALCYAAMSRPIPAERHLPRDDDWENAPRPKTVRKSKTGYPGGW